MAIVRGQTYDARIPLYASDNTPLPLAGASIVSTAVDDAGAVLYTNTLDLDPSGAVESSVNLSLESTAAAGVVLESIPAAETLAFSLGHYIATVTVTLPDGTVYTPVVGIVEVKDATPLTITRHGTDRKTIRRSVARMLSDFYEATDPVGGKTNTFTDLVALARESTHFKGMQILFSNPASPHYGSISTVTVSHGPTRTITFEPPLAQPTIPGETIELYNYRGRGTTISQYNAAINDAIGIARQQHYLIPYRVALTEPFSRTATIIDIPDQFISLSGMSTTERDGHPYRIPPGSYTVDRLGRTVEITRASTVQRLHGLTLTLSGYVMPELLYDDDDTIAIDLDWLYNEVKAALLERMVASGMPIQTADRLFLQERQQAAGKRTLVVTRVVPNTVRLS